MILFLSRFYLSVLARTVTSMCRESIEKLFRSKHTQALEGIQLRVALAEGSGSASDPDK